MLPLPEGHAFPMAKYARLHERVAAMAPALGIRLREPPAATDEDLLRAHEPGYVRAMAEGSADAAMMRRIGFPWSAAMVERSRRSSGGTIMALRAALEGEGVAVNLAGGTHHAGPARGGGYCVFNDAAVAARHVQAHGLARRVLVVDLDVHQGNGTAEICAGDESVFTFSVHAARNYPAVKPASDLDVALPDGTGDAAYLDALAAYLPQAIERARADAVVYLAGADPFQGDRLGYLALSKPGLAERDRQVLEACHRHGLPLAVCMAGGYAPDVEDIVDIHEATVRQAAAHWRRAAGAPAL
ncbi:histone deacetylase [Arenimonas sp.]|uniref:histone deacetylase family protein n=1 Tax=Arenimonas sp. TaxID=1872635 RepID=UPI0035AED147